MPFAPPLKRPAQPGLKILAKVEGKLRNKPSMVSRHIQIRRVSEPRQNIIVDTNARHPKALRAAKQLLIPAFSGLVALRKCEVFSEHTGSEVSDALTREMAGRD